MSRHRLHLTKLDDFAVFCEQHGFVRREPIVGACEVLRLIKPNTPAIIAHKRDRATQHATLHGEGEIMFSRYIRAQRQVQP